MFNEKGYRAKLVHSNRGWLKIGLPFFAGVVLATIGANNPVQAAEKPVWTARSTTQIAQSVAAIHNGKYHIVWGDTLSGITLALQKAGYQTTMARLAAINQIADVNLIYAGNDLLITGSKDAAVITTTDAAGNATGHYNANPAKPVVATPAQVRAAAAQTPTAAATPAATATPSATQAGTKPSTATKPTVTASTTATTPATGTANGGNTSIDATKPTTTQQEPTDAQTKPTTGDQDTASTPTDTGTTTPGGGQATDGGQTTTPDENQTKPAQTGSYEIIYQAADGTVLGSDVHSATLGSTLKLTTTKQFSGYQLSGDATQTVTFSTDGQTIIFAYTKSAPTTATVTINAVDETGKQLVTPTTSTQALGSTYTAAAPTVAGYDLTDSAKAQTVTVNGNTVITFHYQKHITQATLTVNAVDEAGKQLATSSKTLPVGTTTSVSAPTVAGYDLTDNAKFQTVTVNGDTTLTFHYQKHATAPTTATLTINAVDENGKQLSTATKTLTAGTKTSAAAPTIAGYTLQGAASQAVTMTGDQTATFHYQKNPTTASYTIIAVDEAGKRLKTTTVDAQPIGQATTASAPTIAGYTLQGAATQSATVAADGTTAFTFTYKQTPAKQAASYQAVVVDGNGKQIATGTTVGGKFAGDQVTVDAPTIDATQYSLDATTKTATLAAGSNTITFTATAKPVKTSYTINAVDEAGTVLKTSTIADQVVGDTINAAAPTIAGYTHKGAATQSTTVAADGQTVVTFTFIKNAAPTKTAANYSIVAWGPEGDLLDMTDPISGYAGDTVTLSAPTITGYKLADDQTLTVTLKAGENDFELNYVADDSDAGKAATVAALKQALFTRLNDARKAAQTNTDGTLTLSDGTTITSAYTTPHEAQNDAGGQVTIDAALQDAAQQHADLNAKLLNNGTYTAADTGIASVMHSWNGLDAWDASQPYGLLIQQGRNVLSEDIDSVAVTTGSVSEKAAEGLDSFIVGDAAHNNSVLSGNATKVGIGIAEYHTDGRDAYLVVLAFEA